MRAAGAEAKSSVIVIERKAVKRPATKRKLRLKVNKEKRNQKRDMTGLRGRAGMVMSVSRHDVIVGVALARLKPATLAFLSPERTAVYADEMFKLRSGLSEIEYVHKHVLALEMHRRVAEKMPW